MNALEPFAATRDGVLSEEAMRSIFEVRRAYHDSLSNMRNWLTDSRVSGSLTVLDRLSIIDAWQQEMVEFFERNGYCFCCSRRLGRCRCPREPLPIE